MSTPAATESAVATPEEEFPPVNTTDPQLTIRAIITGMLLGAVLSLCNVYAGLKIGWGFNMSITAALLSYGLWQGMHKTVGTRSWGMLENNINQTAASSGASISSAGLVAPIPALTMLTGFELGYGWLVVWVFAVSVVGIIVAVGLRRQMIVVDRLPFPNGIACAETLKNIYADGVEAMARVKYLLSGAVVAGLWKLAIKGKLVASFKLKLGALPGKISVAKTGGFAKGAWAKSGATALSWKNLTFALDPSLLMIAVGGLVGLRAGLSMLIGAVIGWVFLLPWAIEQGWASAGNPAESAMWFRDGVKWLLWPGVAMMVTASLTSFAFAWRSVLSALMPKRSDTPTVQDPHDVPRPVFVGGVILAGALAVATQSYLFDIAVWTAVLAVLMTFVLAIVAGRVSGETGITPVGAMGKVTQLLFGVVSPGDAAANLMAANVTGGAASQCADLLHDMKTGALIGASPRLQATAQLFGVMSGSLAGSAGYLIMIPDPKTMLLTEEWPAPAVVAWKAVAEIFMKGIDAMPEGAVTAMLIAGSLGVIMAVAEKLLPKNVSKWMPSAGAAGLGFTIPAFYAMSMTVGGLINLVAGRFTVTWYERFFIVLCAGVIAGESITGVGIAIATIIGAQ
jgi:putative OPT family oligopeptide transporter